MKIRTWVTLTNGERVESVWGDTDHTQMLDVYARMARLNAGDLPYWEAMTQCGDKRQVVVYVPKGNILYGGVDKIDE